MLLEAFVPREDFHIMLALKKNLGEMVQQPQEEAQRRILIADLAGTLTVGCGTPGKGLSLASYW